VPNPESLILSAYAKLNLALAVGPPQPPKGYHPIASWFVAIELHDTLTLTRLPEGAPNRFDIRWAPDAPKPTPIDWPAEKDLAACAHALLQRHANRPLPVALTLDKRTPVGGGLGGGSSDAAAALSGLNTLFSLGLSRAELAALSTQLGSDIAFFLDDSPAPRPALVTGVGDRIQRLPHAAPAPVILIIPPFGCPTGPVYHAFDRAPTVSADEPRIRSLITAGAAGRIPSADLFNDLAEPACLVEPRLRDTLVSLRTALGPSTPVHVTGSGSTMFCLPRPGDAPAVEAAIRRAAPEVVALPTRLLTPT
jgi:4-diphosphocytidyl-2-C-methyl-D-erythritol kinase